MYHSPVTNALWQAISIFKTTPETVNVESITSKTPTHSRTTILYSFSSDYILREHYRNPWNEIVVGKLIEDLDALAGTISFKHCFNHAGMVDSLLIVTASLDKMVSKKPILVDNDLKIVGAVTWVGRSSMEIQLEVIQSTKEKRSKSRKKKKMQQKKEFENERETERLNALLAEGRVFIDMPALADRDSILINNTCLENSLVCQPQQRNAHGRIFGGFLMKKAFELAFATAYAFAGSVPLFLEVDHVDFLKPVDVGNFLRFKSCVLYTDLENPKKPLINVEVVAHVTRPELKSTEVSNKFYFTFSTSSDAMTNGKISRVVPATEEQAHRVIEHMDAGKC